MTRHEDLLTRKDAAAYLGISTKLLAKLIKPMKFGARVFYSKAECDAFVASMRTQSCSTAEEASGGRSSSSAVAKSASPQERQIADELRALNGDSKAKPKSPRRQSEPAA